MSTDFILSGNIYVDRLTDGGASTGYLEPAEIGKLEIKESTKLKTRKSKGRDTYGQVTATVSLKEPASLKVTLNSCDPDTLAIVLLGEVAARHQTGGTIGSGSPTHAELIPDRWVALPHANLTPHVAITSPIVIATDATTPVDIPLADVEIDHRLGLVKYIGDTLTAATACTLTYKYGDETATRVSGSVKPTIKMRLLLDGKNLVTGDNVRVTIDEATLTPAKAIDFMADDWAEIELEGEMTTLPGKTSPYTVDIIATA
jgi:hypothetical protein